MSSAERLAGARQFLENLAEDPPRLPYEPTLIPLLFSATREGSTTSTEQLTVLIERSQKLAARILSVANSALYALQSRITSINRAVAVLGFNEVRSLVIMIGAASALKGAKLPPGFNGMELWRHQLLTAVYAKALATGLRRSGVALALDPDEAYAAGILHDIGKVFLAGRRPEIWRAVAERAAMDGTDMATAEDAYWGMDHALVGAQVLHFWKLPLLLTDSINWHHSPHLAPSFAVESGVLAAANRLAHLGLTERGRLPEEVVRLLPPRANAAALAEACARATEESCLDVLARLPE